ncbi:MAG: sigma-70 family RNA polymerase sigma factor [Thermodesulfobacteriota bacterium]
MNLPVVADSIDLYLAEIGRYPLLTPTEERTLAERYYEKGSLEDAHRLVTSNLRYVVKVAREYRKYGARLSDLIQEGNIGLMAAVKKFNPYKGFRFITYATWWIRSYIQEYIIKTVGLVKRGTRALKKSLFYKNPALTASEADSVSGGVVRELSLSAPIGEETTTHQDLLCEEAPGQEEVVAEAETHALARREISTALMTLNEKERLVIADRVMADEPASLKALGDRLGLSRERVRQIEGEALKKLGKRLGAKTELMANFS